MEYIDSEIQLGKDELQFNDFIRRGDDFMKINIYRNAKENYNFALETHVNNSFVINKIADCEQKIQKESNIIITVIIVAAFIIGAICLINC